MNKRRRLLNYLLSLATASPAVLAVLIIVVATYAAIKISDSLPDEDHDETKARLGLDS